MSDIHPSMQIRRFEVEELKWETLHVYTLVLKPVVGEKMFSFKAGQWVYLYLYNEDGSPCGRAAFSIATAPEESQEHLELGIKVCGEFTKRGSQLIPGDIVGLQGPFGVFTLLESAKNIVMFAGGIGITPLRSMIRSLSFRNASIPTTLIYSSKTIEDTVYFEELDDLERAWKDFHSVVTLTAELPESWKGERGRIDSSMVKRYVSSLSGTDFYLCGPAAFMLSVQHLLEEQGVDVKKRLKRESFG